MLYAIATPGPLMEHEADTLDDALDFAARYMPMKREWTHDVTRSDDGKSATLHALNSNGRRVNAFRVFPFSRLRHSDGSPVRPRKSLATIKAHSSGNGIFYVVLNEYGNEIARTTNRRDAEHAARNA